MHACKHWHTHADAHTYIHTHTCLHACMHTHMHTHTQHINMLACMQACTHTHIYTYTCYRLVHNAVNVSVRKRLLYENRKALFSASLQRSHLRSMSKACAQQTTECWRWMTFSSLTATIQPTAAAIAPRCSLSAPVQPVFPWHLSVTTRTTVEMAAMKLIAVSSDDGFAHRQQHEGSTCTWQHFNIVSTAVN